MLIDQQCAFTRKVALLILKANELGYAIKVQEWNRDVEKQKHYIATGKSKLTDPYKSKHVVNLAVDLVLHKDGVTYTWGEAFRPLGLFWESLGGRWGGRFGYEDKPKEVQAENLGWDSCHFEFRESSPS